MGICKFCGQEKKLIKAHIIPKKFYLNIKNNRFSCMNIETMEYKHVQMGSYDRNILCAECDNNILGEFDKEGYRVLFGDFNKYKYYQLNKNERTYELNKSEFDYNKFRNFFISILWRASVSSLPEWKWINLGSYEKKAFEILKNKKEYNDLFKILIYKNCYQEDINSLVLIGKIKTRYYKKYIIQMAGYRIEVIVDPSRIPKENLLIYKSYFLNPYYACIMETPEVSRRINKEHKDVMWQLFERGFKPPKPPGVE